MQVITIQSEVWNSIHLILQDIKTSVEVKKKQQPLTHLWLTIEETMAQLKVSKRTLQNYRDNGRIGFSKIEGKIYFKAIDIDEFLERHYHKPFSKN